MPEAKKAEVANDYEDTVWIFKQGIKEVNGQVGFVAVPFSLGQKLIKEGKAQDPRVGGLDLNYIEGEEPKPAAKRGRKPAKPTNPKEIKPAKPVVAKEIKPGGKVQKVITQDDETTKSFLS